MKNDYTYDEVRSMLRWELEKKADHPLSLADRAEVDAVIRSLTDNVLNMWEQAGLFDRSELQSRVQEYRDAIRNGQVD